MYSWSSKTFLEWELAETSFKKLFLVVEAIYTMVLFLYNT